MDALLTTLNYCTITHFTRRAVYKIHIVRSTNSKYFKACIDFLGLEKTGNKSRTFKDQLEPVLSLTDVND